MYVCIWKDLHLDLLFQNDVKAQLQYTLCIVNPLHDNDYQLSLSFFVKNSQQLQLEEVLGYVLQLVCVVVGVASGQG